MKKLILLLSLISSLAFGIDKKTPTGGTVKDKPGKTQDTFPQPINWSTYQKFHSICEESCTPNWNITLNSTGGSRQLVNVIFKCQYNCTNGTGSNSKITLSVKDGSTVLYTNEHALGSPTVNWSGYLVYPINVVVPKPNASAYTISVADTESDGAAHTFNRCTVSGSATTIQP